MVVLKKGLNMNFEEFAKQRNDEMKRAAHHQGFCSRLTLRAQLMGLGVGENYLEFLRGWRECDTSILKEESLHLTGDLLDFYLQNVGGDYADEEDAIVDEKSPTTNTLVLKIIVNPVERDPSKRDYVLLNEITTELKEYGCIPSGEPLFLKAIVCKQLQYFQEDKNGLMTDTILDGYVIQHPNVEFIRYKDGKVVEIITSLRESLKDVAV